MKSDATFERGGCGIETTILTTEQHWPRRNVRLNCVICVRIQSAQHIYPSQSLEWISRWAQLILSFFRTVLLHGQNIKSGQIDRGFWQITRWQTLYRTEAINLNTPKFNWIFPVGNSWDQRHTLNNPHFGAQAYTTESICLCVFCRDRERSKWKSNWKERKKNEVKIQNHSSPSSSAAATTTSTKFSTSFSSRTHFPHDIYN